METTTEEVKPETSLDTPKPAKPLDITLAAISWLMNNHTVSQLKLVLEGLKVNLEKSDNTQNTASLQIVHTALDSFLNEKPLNDIQALAMCWFISTQVKVSTKSQEEKPQSQEGPSQPTT